MKVLVFKSSKWLFSHIASCHTPGYIENIFRISSFWFSGHIASNSTQCIGLQQVFDLSNQNDYLGSTINLNTMMQSVIYKFWIIAVQSPCFSINSNTFHAQLTKRCQSTMPWFVFCFETVQPKVHLNVDQTNLKTQSQTCLPLPRIKGLHHYVQPDFQSE